MPQIINRLVFLLFLSVLLTGSCETTAVYAGSKDLGGLGQEQADEKQDLEKMRAELNDIKGSINEGLEGLKKIDTTAIKNLQEFHLICKTGSWEIAPGKTIDCLTYNGIMPGPTIRVKEGQLVRLIVHNQLSTPTSLHLHGMVLPDSVDGLPNAQAGLIKPGQTYAYQFVAKPVGTYWYHPQIIHANQKAKGMYGAFIVEPADAAKSVDQDLVLLLSDIAAIKSASSAAAEQDSPSIPNVSRARPNLFARKPLTTPAKPAPAVETKFTVCDTTSSHPHLTFYLINGKTAPAIPSIDVEENSRIRLRLINCGQHAIPLHISGHKFELISVNGNLTGEQTNRDTLTLGVSDRADIEFTANNPGTWSLGSELVQQSTDDGQFPGGIACLLRYNNH